MIFHKFPQLREVCTDTFRIDLNMPLSYPPIAARHTKDGGVRDRFFAAKAELPDEITVLHPFSTDGFPLSNAHTIYVSPNGCDQADGSVSNPVRTIQEAVQRVENLGGARIILRGGDYNLTETIFLRKEHSGTEHSPLILTAYEKEIPRISGSVSIPVSAFGPITDAHQRQRLKADVRDKIVAADLRKLGITEYGNMENASPALLVNNIPQTLAQYPNVGEPQIPMSQTIYETGGVTRSTSTLYERDHHKNCPWEIGISDSRMLDWEWKDDIYIYGALYAEWARERIHVASIDREKMSMKGSRPFTWGVQYHPNNDYYFLNVFEELDTPGEWYLDRESGILYLYPPHGSLTETDDIRLAAAPFPLMQLQGTENVILDRLHLGRCFGCAVIAQDCRATLIQRCHIDATISVDQATDEGGITLRGGFRSGVIATTFEHFTTKAASIGGGDRAQLKPSNLFIQNCVLKNPGCRFGLVTSGMGNLLSHNYLLDTTIIDNGSNEGIVEYNILEGGDATTHDSGGIYVAGGGLSSCGNHYRYNYLFDFKKAGYCIYFDDLSRGMYAYGNIVCGCGGNGVDSWGPGERSYNIHNGGEHCFWGNISIDAGYFAFGGDISYYRDGCGCSSIWEVLVQSILDASRDKRTAHYLGRNPTYRDYLESFDTYLRDREKEGYTRGEAEERIRTPAYNNFENNVIVRAGRPFKLDTGEATATSLATNYITNDDPGFVDFRQKDYHIRPDAPLYRKIPDFVPPPVDKMGPCVEA